MVVTKTRCGNYFKIASYHRSPSGRANLQINNSRRSGKLLLDYQPLKKYQQQFDVEVPWKECEVVVQSGRFAGYQGVVKNVRQDFRGSPHLSLWMTVFNCSIEIDHSAVVERWTKLPLLDYQPLEGNELREFKPNSLLQEMRTGPCPWLGMLVDITKGEFKGQYGAVRDVNHYEPDSRRAKGQSGIELTVERFVMTAGSTILVKVDYDAVRYHRTGLYLCDVFMPTPKQSFYIPNKAVRHGGNVLQVSQATKTAWPLPPPADLEQETIFIGPWSEVHRTPISSPAMSSNPAPTTPLVLTSPLPSPWNPASSPLHMQGLSSPYPRPPPQSEPTTSQPPSTFDGPWILHPKLVGIPIQVDINGGEMDTSNKRTGIFVETVADSKGSISVIS
ncbi:hypothetical protein GGU10DRAFT_381844 [Lentinula aff. detonsa]|uniref:KOW domain-containing protein n=1 Tax=Lentinula aff. detonsa TaxID=2804958 RepID=A0AA38L296_9AGAR|nr:hypothetical protein GGU10DRAFT_381844 [Lentinula aff. detonsa]